MKDKIEKLKKELKELERQEQLESLFDDKNMPFTSLAEIGQGLKVSDEARLKYEELFKDFVHNKLWKLREELEKQLKKKKFVIKIGWE